MKWTGVFVILLAQLLTPACSPPLPVDEGGGDPSGTAPGGVPAELEFAPKACLNPQDRDELGPFVEWTSSDWKAQAVEPNESGAVTPMAWGVAVADFDGDGLRDLLLPGRGGASLWRGIEAGGWVLAPPPAVEEPYHLLAGAAVADFDADGLNDVVVTGAGVPSLLRNEGDGHLVVQGLDEGNDLGLDDLGGGILFSAAIGDSDGDGDLDLILPAFGDTRTVGPTDPIPPGDPTRLLANNGDGTFSDAGEGLPAETNDGYPFIAAFVDVDSDGDPDILLPNDDHGQRSRTGRLWLNDGVGGYQDISQASGADTPLTAMGIGVADINGDLVPDFFISGTREVAILESTGPLQWARTDLARGLVPSLEDGQHVGWGVDVGDLENDGDIDVWTAFGWWPPEQNEQTELQPDAVWVQDDDGLFEDMAGDLGLDDTGWGRGGLMVDLNEDGWLDLVRRRMFELPRIDLARCGAADWLRVRLLQAGPNRNAIGARVLIEAGDRTQVRWVAAGGRSVSSGGPPEVHFGLGHVDAVDRLVVSWPDGKTSELNAVPVQGTALVRRID